MAIDKICPLPKNNKKLRANISEDEPLAYFIDDFSIKDESMIGIHSVSPKSQLSNNRERGKNKESLIVLYVVTNFEQNEH